MALPEQFDEVARLLKEETVKLVFFGGIIGGLVTSGAYVWRRYKSRNALLHDQFDEGDINIQDTTYIPSGIINPETHEEYVDQQIQTHDSIKLNDIINPAQLDEVSRSFKMAAGCSTQKMPLVFAHLKNKNILPETFLDRVLCSVRGLWFNKIGKQIGADCSYSARKNFDQRIKDFKIWSLNKFSKITKKEYSEMSLASFDKAVTSIKEQWFNKFSKILSTGYSQDFGDRKVQNKNQFVPILCSESGRLKVIMLQVHKQGAKIIPNLRHMPKDPRNLRFPDKNNSEVYISDPTNRHHDRYYANLAIIEAFEKAQEPRLTETEQSEDHIAEQDIYDWFTTGCIIRCNGKGYYTVAKPEIT